jgi:hypothetical protein
MFAYFVLWFIVCVGMHMQFLVTVGYLTWPTPSPLVFVIYLFPKMEWLILSLPTHLKHYFVSPGWNRGVNLKD